ncbi:hypothetical protein [Aestuariivirga sp.]|uniref:hypothetical protein n=1 Tax=Aestuariivirga sp. TaxID=2650926 RepID=UPI0035945155
MPHRNVTAFFHERGVALQAIDRLVQDGIPREAIRIFPEADASGSPNSPRGVANDAKEFWDYVGEHLMPDLDNPAYRKALKRGHIMVVACVEDPIAFDAEDILDEYGTVRLDELDDGRDA